MNNDIDTYLDGYITKAKVISEVNEYFHTKFERFFDSMECSSLSDNVYDSLFEERELQRDIFYKQVDIIDDFENEIRVQKKNMAEKAENKNEESKNGSNN